MILPEGYALIGHTIVVMVENKEGVPRAVPIATISDHELLRHFLRDYAIAFFASDDPWKS